jgi:putative chitinase
MNTAEFFAAARTSVFGGKLAQTQVDGITALLEACADLGVVDDRHVAYILATPMIETGGTFVPITESLNYSSTALMSKFGKRITPAQAAQYGRTNTHPANQEAIGNIIYGGPWGAADLGNTQPGDGNLFRGRGLSQVTGRRLYTIFGYADNPEAVATLRVSAEIMVKAMRDGMFTGKKLGDYFSATVTDFVNARRIVNGLDRATDMAVYAKKFLACMEAAR